MQLLCEKRYLNLPVRTGAQKRHATVHLAGRVLRNFEFEYAPTDPEFWVQLDLAPFAGKTIELTIDPPLSPLQASQLLPSDTPAEADTLYQERAIKQDRKIMRPAFHFTSKRGWLNDPNGLVYFDGEYHLFYQHNPFGTQWGNIHWGHAVSPDLVHWEELGDALQMAEHARDMVFSGCALVDEKNTAGFQTGAVKTLLAFFTDTGLGECLAYSNDHGRSWTLYENNPVVAHKGRDPRVLWYANPSGGGHWVMVLYDENTGGRDFVFYTSPDLKAWTFASRIEGFYECPDLVRLTIDGDPNRARWVLYAADGRYHTGAFDGYVFTPDGALQQLWRGNFYAAQTYSNAPDGRCIQIGWGRGIEFADLPFNQQMTVPVDLSLRTTADGMRLCAQPVRELKTLRIWRRDWSAVALTDGEKFTQGLLFRCAPNAAHWHDITLLPADGSPSDIKAAGYELRVSIDLGAAERITIDLQGQSIIYDVAAQTLSCAHVSAKLAPHAGHLELCALLDSGSLEIFGGDGRAQGQVALSVAYRGKLSDRTLRVFAEGGDARLLTATLFGLRTIWPTPHEIQLRTIAAADERVVFRAAEYTVYGGRVEDEIYGAPHAYVPDRDTILSPTRVIETFAFADTQWSDMTRVIDRDAVWHPRRSIERFPDLRSGYNTVDAAYRLALDILHSCGGSEFARVGEEGMWAAGQFQGPGAGFGVWVRDSAHVALRMGNLLDAATARRTLLHTARFGHDNGIDGVPMPINGMWDYYLATGDDGPMRQTWSNLKDRVARMDARYDVKRGLIVAEHATSNDAFPEPESGNFSLGTETYYMDAYLAMARMGARLGEDTALTTAWTARGEQLRAAIRDEYWHDAAGFFTTGPKGSDGYTNRFWESAGVETAIWPRFGIATPEQRRRTLDQLPHVAMNDYGVNVFPYRPEVNHFCNAAWVSWTAGMASAANAEGRLDLLERLIGQQVRNAVINKTFYEVIDYKTGRAWRWPGQLWQATGFLSYFYYGLLGVAYEEDGLRLHAAAPQAYAGLQINGWRYRAADLDVCVNGWGVGGRVLLDGAPVTVIPATLMGKHSIVLEPLAEG